MNIIERLRRRAPAWPATLARPHLSQDGSVAVMTAIAAIVILGMVSLGIEVTGVLLTLQRMQSSADAAAMAGAQAIESDAVTSLKVDAQGVAAADGFTSGTSGEVVTVNNPPLSGVHAGNALAVEVIISQPQTLPLSGLLYSGTWNVKARGVAVAGSTASSCVLALDPASVAAVNISNGVKVVMNGCGLAVNAAGATALTVIGGSTLTASSVTVVGSTTVNGGGAIDVTGAIKTAQPATANPYASVAVPTFSGCNYGAAGAPYTLAWASTTQTLKPGVYCGGLPINISSAVVMSAGVYIINAANSPGAAFTVGGGAQLTGTGVTIVLTGSGANYATVSIGNGSTVTLSPPTSGATAGLLFFEDPKGPTTGADTFTGGATMTLTGALYFPTQTVTFNGGASTNAQCTQLVAWMIVFAGGATFNSSCATIGITTIGGGPSTLVE